MTDQPFKMIAPHRELDGTVSYVLLRGGYEAPRRFVAESPTVTLDVELDSDGTAHCRAIIVRAQQGGDVTGDTLRRIPVARLLKQATAGAARYREPVEPGGPPVFHLFRPGPRDAEFYREYVADARRPRRGSPLTDDQLRRVADLYRAALDRGDPPTQTISDELHAARSTAARWVSKARERGLLGPALPGQAGERKEGR